VKILVLGIGNILLRDEGVGVRAIEALKERYIFPENVELMDGGTAGFELFGPILDHDYLLLLDAIACEQPPGTVMRIEGDSVRARFISRISPHQLGISDVLAAASLACRLPTRLVLFGIEPKDLGTGLDLSREVAAGLDKLVNGVVRELTVLGCAVQFRPSA